MPTGPIILLRMRQPPLLREARKSISSFFGTSPEQMVYTSGATEAINLVSYAWARENLSSGDVIVLTEMEHHADIVPWQQLSKEKGVEVRYVPIDTDSFTLTWMHSR